MRLLLLHLAFLFVVGCSIQLNIDTDSDDTYNLSFYKSFSIEASDLKEQPSQISINPILLQRTSRAIEQSLTRRGLNKTSEPDMIVRFFITTEREVERSRSYSSWYRSGYFDDGDQRFYRVDKDSLTIRFHDFKTNEVIWYAFSRFNRSSSISDQTSVNLFIERVLSEFDTNP